MPFLLLLVAGLVAARVALALAYDLDTINEESLGGTILVMLAFATYLVVGLVLVARRPGHRLGWVLTAIGVLTLFGVLAESYAMVALVISPGHLPGGTFAAWIQNWYWFPLLGLIFLFVPMLFPDGRPLSPRWNWLYYTGTLCLLLMTVLGWMKPTLTGGDGENPDYRIDNPIGVDAVGDLEQSTHGDVLFFTLLALGLCALVSLALRFRRSRDLERQQLKLFLFSGVLMVVLPIGEEMGLERLLPETNLFFAVAIGLPPVAIGVAVLRYRLYDIDRLISRTLSYALLTGLLLALYLGAVTALTAVTAPVTGDSPLAVAAATLLAAAAFGPARRRIQAIVDRRFNRARYDAARTVEAYRGSLRDHVEIAALTTELLGAVDKTVQPIKTVLWLREAPPGGGAA